MTEILKFVTSTIGRYVVGGLGIVALIGMFSIREQNKGAAKLATKIEVQNAKVTAKAVDAARKSADPSASGVRNPYTRAD
jgi:hypothetical protein